MKEWKIFVGFEFVFVGVVAVIKPDSIGAALLGAGIVMAILGWRESDD